MAQKDAEGEVMLPDPSQWYYVGKCRWCGAALYEQGGRYQWKDGGFDCLHELEGDDAEQMV